MSESVAEPSPCRVQFGRDAPAAQKNVQRRTIEVICGKIIVLRSTVWLWVFAVACGPSVVNLGFRGAELASAGVSGAASGLPTPRDATGGGGSGVAGVAGMPTAAGMQFSAGAAGQANAGAVGMMPARGPGCGLPPSASDTSLQINGSTTSYIVDLPTGYDPNRPYPLVVALRGASVTAAAFHSYLNLAPVVGADGIVVNLECADKATTWDVQRDLPFFDALLVKLQAQYCIDAQRMFVVGHAAGAMFANSLVCMRGGVLRGLGSLSGAAPTTACASKIGVWITQGNADSTVTLGRADRDFWLQQNGCDATMQMSVDPSPCVAYGRCDSGYPVTYCEYNGTLDLPSFAASGVWSFFRDL